MLEYFSYKKIKKHQAERKSAASTPSAEPSSKAAETKKTEAAVQTPPAHVQSPILSEEDAYFLERVVSAEGTPPPLPTRPPHEDLPEAGDSTGNTAQVVVSDKGKGKENEKPADKKKSRFSFLNRSGTKKNDGLQPDPNVTPSEADKEEDDITRILEDLNLSAVNNRAFSLSAESQKLVQQFTVILKDLINGVPTAYDDLTHLLDNSSDVLQKNYSTLPSFLQKLITQLPDKLTKNLAPELLAVMAESAAMGEKTAGATSFGAAAKGFLKPTSLKDLVTKPGAVVSLLKAIMNALKLRWPAFMGTNVLLSLALFVLLFVFWYCHKRGREVRLEKEGKPVVVDSEGRIVELDDDPMIGSSAQAGDIGVGPPTPAGLATPVGDTLAPERPKSSRSRKSEEKARKSREGK